MELCSRSKSDINETVNYGGPHMWTQEVKRAHYKLNKAKGMIKIEYICFNKIKNMINILSSQIFQSQKILIYFLNFD